MAALSALALVCVDAAPAPAAGIDGTLAMPFFGTHRTLTTDGRPAAVASFFTLSGYGPVISGPVGHKVFSYRITPGGVPFPTQRALGIRSECPDEGDTQPRTSVYKLADEFLNLSDCYEAGPNPSVVGSGRIGQTFPLAAHVFDAGTGDGLGEPVVLTDIVRTGGLQDVCGTGVLGIRDVTKLHRGDGIPASYLYDRAVEVRDQIYLPIGESEWRRSTPAELVERGRLAGPPSYTALYAPAAPDVSAPFVTITAPADCAEVAQGEALPVRYACEDPRVDANAPDTLASCSAPVPSGGLLDTSVPGHHTFTVTGTDAAGNRRSRTIRYTVHAGDFRPAPALAREQQFVRGLAGTDGRSSLGVGERGVLTLALGRGTGCPNPDATDGGECLPGDDAPIFLRGVHMAEPLYEHELTNLPTESQVACRQTNLLTDADGVQVQVVRCNDLSQGPSQAFLPVVAVQEGTFRVGPGNDVDDLRISVGDRPCDAGLLVAGCWRFGEPSGATASDASGNGNDGAYVGGPGLGLPGVRLDDTGVSLDGRDDHVVVPDSPSLDVADSFTLEGWIRRDEDGHTHQLFNKGARGFHLLVMDRFNGNQVWLRKAGVSTIVRTAGGVPADGRYHHVVATKDGPRSTQVYIDGQAQELEQASPGQIVENTAARLFLSATASGNGVAGDLDEFAVYDRALTPGEVQERFARGEQADAPTARSTASAQTRAGHSASSRTWWRDRRRHVAATSSSRRATALAGACGDLGTPHSGVTGIQLAGAQLGGLDCAAVRAAVAAGPSDLRAAGFDCRVTDERFGEPVVRITRSCTTLLGVHLRYTTLS